MLLTTRRKLSRLLASASSSSASSLVDASDCNDIQSSLRRNPTKNRVRLASSSSSGSSTSCVSTGSSWCSLAYWELDRRLIEPLRVFSDSVDVFTASKLPAGTGLCLDNAFAANPTPSARTTRVRQNIGRGIVLVRERVEGGRIWVYNRTQSAIFVHSPVTEAAFQDRKKKSASASASASSTSCGCWRVHRVPSGFSLAIFDYDSCPEVWSTGLPFDEFSVRISFGKGFGVDYWRQDVAMCPCWLELYLTPS